MVSGPHSIYSRCIFEIDQRLYTALLNLKLYSAKTLYSVPQLKKKNTKIILNYLCLNSFSIIEFLIKTLARNVLH